MQGPPRYPARTRWAEQAWAVARKDLLLEARSRTNINSLLFFAATVLLLFSFALGPNLDRLRAAAGGLLWLALVLSGVLAFGRTYQLEVENNAFEGLLLVARSPSAIYAGKVLGTVAVMLTVEVVIIPVMAVLYNLDLWGAILPLMFVGLLGTLGYAAVGALYGALTMSLRAREVLLPLLLLPVTVPIILGAVRATNDVLSGQYADMPLWLELLAAFDVVFLTTGLIVFEHALSD